MSNKRAVSANDLPDTSEPPVAHPLAYDLARELASHASPVRVLLLGVGSGRNLPVLIAACAHVEAIEEDDARFRDVAARFPLADVRRAAYAGPYPYAPGFAGTLSDARSLAWSPSRGHFGDRSGPRRIVAGRLFLYHARLYAGSTLRGRSAYRRRYVRRHGGPGNRRRAFVFSMQTAVHDLFARFELTDLSEVSAAETAGRWAHSEADASTLVHWFVRARARADG